jgi:hypothetical protein
MISSDLEGKFEGTKRRMKKRGELRKVVSFNL